MSQLENYVCGRWQRADKDVVDLRDASTGEVIASTSAAGINVKDAADHARTVGGPALREMTFHERAGMLRGLVKHLMQYKEEFYALSYCTGATKTDSWVDIDGGTGTMAVFASKGQRELPNSRILLDGPPEAISKNGTFVGQHIWVPLEGVAVHINAFNFPVWGMLEKLAPALLAGVPAIVKPATVTSYLTERVVRRIVDSGLLPQGALQLICGSLGDLFDHLECQDVVAFTGSAATAFKLRAHPTVLRNSVRFTAETDSLNACILGPDAVPGTPEFDLFVKEVVREMTVKAGQKCTAIRRALVPAASADAVADALREALGKIVVGDPRSENVRMGPLAGLDQRKEVLANIKRLREEADVLFGDPDSNPAGLSSNGAFVRPTLLRCRDVQGARAVHEVEAFGPVSTLIPYTDVPDAIRLARRGQGSLVGSIFTADDQIAAQLALGLAAYHGRLLIANRHCAKESTGHGSPLAHLVHGGPGRAGGGEELGGIRGVTHYMQRVAVQGSPDALTAVGQRWIRGAVQRNPGAHPFRKPLNELQIGDTFNSSEREVTVADIEQFAQLTGDTFYAHMSDSEAARNPLFGGRVAHGYFLISAAAGLFVDPAYGPVLGNYGLDNLRFVKPVKPGDRIKVRLTCKEKSLRADKGWGEVRWDTEVTNQAEETVAAYEVLTMVSVHAVPDVLG